MKNHKLFMPFIVIALLLSQSCKFEDTEIQAKLKTKKKPISEVGNESEVKVITITGASISAGRLNIDGTNLDAVSEVRPVSSNLSGYTMVIESQTASRAVIRLTHALNSTLAIAVSTLLVFSVDTANASTTVNLTINDGIPAGSVVAMNSATCPTGWSDFNDANGRVVVGAGSGNNDVEATALTTRIFGTSGGTEFPVVMAANVNGNAGAPLPTTVQARISGVSAYIDRSNTNSSLGGSNAVTEGNMQPYIVLKYCVKN